MTKHPIIVALAVVAALSVTACGSKEEPAASTGAAVPSGTEESPVNADDGFTPVVAGKFTVCTNPPYAPFEDEVNGEIVGFDLDLMNEVAKDLGLTMEARVTPFETIESAASLDVGDCDAGASGLTINEARQAKLDFSDSYYETTLGLLVKADSGIKGLTDLEGKAVGVQQGTTGEDWAGEQPEIKDNLRQFENLGDQTTALLAGEVDGVLNDLPTLTPYSKDGTMKVAADFQTGERFGFAVKKGNAALVDQINKTLERVHSDGTYDALITKWFENQE